MLGLIDTRIKQYDKKTNQYINRNNNNNSVAQRKLDRKNKRYNKQQAYSNKQKYCNNHNDNSNQKIQHNNKRAKTSHNVINNNNNSKNDPNTQFMQMLRDDNLITDTDGYNNDEKTIIDLENKLNIKTKTSKNKLRKEFIDDGLDELLNLCDEYQDKGLLKHTQFNMKHNDSSDEQSINENDDENNNNSDNDDMIEYSDNDEQLDSDDNDAHDNNIESDSDNNSNSNDDIDAEEAALLKRLAEIRKAKKQRKTYDNNQIVQDNISDNEIEYESDDSVDSNSSEISDEQHSDNNNVDSNDSEQDDNNDNEHDEHTTTTSKQSYDDLYGFNTPTPQSLLDFKGLTSDNNSNISTQQQSSSITSSKYIPPHARKQPQNNNNTDSNDDYIISQINIILNKLSDSNLSYIIQSLYKLCTKYSKYKIYNILCQTIHIMIDNKTQLQISQCIYNAAVCTAIHILNDITAGSLFVETSITKLNILLQQDYNNIVNNNDNNDNNDDIVDTESIITNKQSSNLVLLLSYYYNFSLINASLIFEIIQHIIDNSINRYNKITEYSIELLVVILQHTGLLLRQNNAIQLKQIIIYITNAVQKYSNTNNDNNSRIQYMINIINSIKNNKKHLYENNKESIEYCKTQIMNIIKQLDKSIKTIDYTIDISLNDYLNVKTNGRWWLTGGTYKGQQYNNSHHNNSNNNSSDTVSNNKEIDPIDQIARNLNLNTKTKKSILSIIVNANNINECIAQLDNILKVYRTDVIQVIMICFLNETIYNNYYEALLLQLYELDNGVIKILDSFLCELLQQLDQQYNDAQIVNLSQLLGKLISDDVLSIRFISTLSLIQPTEQIVLLMYNLLTQICQQVTDTLILQYIFNVFNLKHKYKGFKLHLINFIKKYCIKTNKQYRPQFKHIIETLQHDTIDYVKHKKKNVDDYDEFDLLV